MLLRDVDSGIITLSLMVFPSLIIVIIIFRFAHKYNRLSQVSPLIIAIGFFIYLLSQIFRPILQFTIGKNVLSVVIAEIIDIFAFTIIFIGIIKKSNYKTIPNT